MTLAEKIGELEERKSLEDEAFHISGARENDRAEHQHVVGQIDEAIETYRGLTRRHLISDLQDGTVIAFGNFAPYEPEIVVPPSYWSFLSLDIQSATARWEELVLRKIELSEWAAFSEEQRVLVQGDIAKAARQLREWSLRARESQLPLGRSKDRPLYVSAEINGPVSVTHTKEWETGVSLSRAAELLDPEAWGQYKENYIPLLVVGDPTSEERRRLANTALRLLRDSILSHIEEGALEVRTLYPPGEPTAKWTPLSDDVIGSLDPSDIDFGSDTIRLPGGARVEAKIIEVRDIRRPARALTSHDTSDPVYSLIAKEWGNLTEQERKLINSRGGMKKVREILQSRIPHAKPQTIEREFTRFVATENLKA